MNITILILTRYYIYKCRINNKQLNLLAWIHEVKFFIQIEKMIAIKTDRYYKFIKYWETLTRKSGVLGSIPGLATYFPFSFRFFKKGSCQLLAKVCARSTG